MYILYTFLLYQHLVRCCRSYTSLPNWYGWKVLDVLPKRKARYTLGFYVKHRNSVKLRSSELTQEIRYTLWE